MRLFVFQFLVPTCGAMLWATSGASGWYSPHCDGASFYLSTVDGLASDQKLNLNLRQRHTWWSYRPQEIWEDVYAERCTSEGKCEPATQARIWLDKGSPNDRRVSGKYEVDFGAQHLSGRFVTKYRKGKGWICE
jgi:hypothetical protein